MNEILQQNPWFRPSQATLNKWLFTRKRPVRGTNFEAPGLLGTSNFGTDGFLFALAVVLEIVGLIAFYIFFGSIIFAMLFFVLDFIFAIGSHWNQGRLTVLRNQMALVRDFSFGEQKDIDSHGDLKPIAARILWRKRTMRRFKWTSRFFCFLISGIAAFKVAGFMNGWANTGEDFGVIPMLISISYTLVASIHIYVTGFLFSELYVRWAARRELAAHLHHREYSVSVDNPYEAKDIHVHPPLEFTWPDTAEIPGLPAPGFARAHVSFNNHWIKYTTLYTFGVLTDSDITGMQGLISDPNGNRLTQKKDIFIKNALHHQLVTILSSSPATNAEDPPPVPAPPPTPVFPLPSADNAVENDNETYPWFAPSHATRNKWLFTRKRQYGAGNFRAPGLFGTHGFGKDAFLFTLAVALEIVGLAAFYIFFGSILFAVLFFVLDFLLAVLSHWNADRSTVLKNQRALLMPNCNPDFQFSENKDLNRDGSLKTAPARLKWRSATLLRFKIYSGIFYGLIVLLGAIKVAGFINGWTETGEEFGNIPILIIVTYALVAGIHIYATGYFFAEVFFRFHYNSERREHKLTHNYTIPGYVMKDNVTAKPMPHGINQEYHHLIGNKLYTFGILKDTQIFNMINPVSLARIPIEDFLKNCIHHQITDILPSTPNIPEVPIRVNNMVPPVPVGMADPGSVADNDNTKAPLVYRYNHKSLYP
jgi:hypothetical protein